MVFFQRQRLVEGQAPGGVDIAGEQVGLQGGGVFDHPCGDAAEIRLAAGPERVGGEARLIARGEAGHQIGAVPQARRGGGAVVERLAAVLQRVFRGAKAGFFQMRRDRVRAQPVEIIARRVEVDDVGGGVDLLDADQAGFGVELAFDIKAQGDVVAGEGDAVAPSEAGAQGEADGEAVIAFPRHAAIGERGDLGAEVADQGVVDVEPRDHPPGEAVHVAAHELVGDERVHIGGKFHHADAEAVAGGLRRGGAGGEQQASGEG